MRFLLALALGLSGCAATTPMMEPDAATPVDAGVDAGVRDAGTDAGVLDAGPGYHAWTSCGFLDAGCVCKGFTRCSAISGGTFTGLGSQRVRVCESQATDCVFTVFTEVEGGGTAQRCHAPKSQLSCAEGVVGWTDGGCEPLFTCNQLMGNCPNELTPCP